MALLHYFHFFSNLQKITFFTQFYYLTFKILIANLESMLAFLNKHSFMKGSWGITADVNICFINYEIRKTLVIKTH